VAAAELTSGKTASLAHMKSSSRGQGWETSSINMVQEMDRKPE